MKISNFSRQEIGIPTSLSKKSDGKSGQFPISNKFSKSNFQFPKLLLGNLLLVFVCSLLFDIWILGGYIVLAQELPTSTGAESAITAIQQWTLLDKVQQGIALLQASPALKYQTTKAGALTRKQVALAVLDKNSGQVFEKRIWLNQNEINSYRRTGLLRAVPVEPNESFNIQPLEWNSFNTPYQIVGRSDLIVVANKYLMPTNGLLAQDRALGRAYTDIVYVSYSPSLHDAQLVEAGKKYLEVQVDAAFVQLEVANVKSKSLPGQLVTAGFDKDFIKNIALIEQIDPGKFTLSFDSGLGLAERVLVILGGNQERAYRYTFSPKGANGLAQFIKPTYDLMVRQYPQAKLTKDYRQGMADHTNAVKAMVLFFDYHRKQLNDRIARKDVVNQLGITEQMLAAAYNGGPGRVVRAVNNYGFNWSSSAFKREVAVYLKKFEAVKNLNIF